MFLRCSVDMGGAPSETGRGAGAGTPKLRRRFSDSTSGRGACLCAARLAEFAAFAGLPAKGGQARLAHGSVVQGWRAGLGHGADWRRSLLSWGVFGACVQGWAAGGGGAQRRQAGPGEPVWGA